MYPKPLDFIRRYVQTVTSALQELPAEDLVPVLKALEKAHQERRQVFIAGNGGSAATAQHMANDLMKGVAKGSQRGFRAIALSSNLSAITAIANDEGYTEVFSSQLMELAQPEDLLIVLSASGNSPNILRALEVAQKISVTTIGLLGMGGGKAARMVDIAVVVPSDEYGPVEDLHLMLDHLITSYFQNCMKTQNVP